MAFRLSGLALVSTLVLAAPSASAAEQATAGGIVLRDIGIVDGDSILIDGQEWRLLGFDTPETDLAACEAERRLGLMAKARLEALVRSGARLQIEGGQERDRYRRPLGTLRVNGRDVRDIMIEEGWARPYNGGRKKGWCSRDSRDDLVPGPKPVRRRR